MIFTRKKFSPFEKNDLLPISQFLSKNIFAVCKVYFAKKSNILVNRELYFRNRSTRIWKISKEFLFLFCLLQTQKNLCWSLFIKKCILFFKGTVSPKH